MTVAARTSQSRVTKVLDMVWPQINVFHQIKNDTAVQVEEGVTGNSPSSGLGHLP